ncbi:hypothetical protein SEA_BRUTONGASTER_57 [Gordonia phage BrutonGaster]|uniref:Uncharacterized protein n=1 Tax=Gordonia phage BrutonGaster TaxID=2530116 RepID=A0A482JN52_9CAUD|nr:hypothetical protein HOV26_gp125 [Gordonia phage BrutonGaster]QBP33274.1 hypothetical protein SEA_BRUTONGASTER_57 [Gordonia phage BrutonGaster]
MAYIFDKSELAALAEVIPKIDDATGSSLGNSQLYIDMEPIAVKSGNNNTIGHILWDDGFVGFRPADGEIE